MPSQSAVTAMHRRLLASRPAYLPALTLALALLVANVVAQPSFLAPSRLPEMLGLAAPLLIVAMASAPSILSGGIDISVGPLVGFTSIFYVTVLLSGGLGDPLPAIPIVLALGAAVGVINGVAIAMLRFPPVLATLCMFFVLGGVNLKLLPSAEAAQSNWVSDLSDTVWFFPGALLTIGGPLLIWWLLGRTAFLRNLYAAGGNDAAALSAGVRVGAARVGAYALGGLFAAIAGFALTSVLGGADASVSNTYTLVAIAAVSLGGVSLGGGRGGLVGALVGGVCIYLIQSLLTTVGASAGWLPASYGAFLVLGIVFAARHAQRGARTVGA